MLHLPRTNNASTSATRLFLLLLTSSFFTVATVPATTLAYTFNATAARNHATANYATQYCNPLYSGGPWLNLNDCTLYTSKCFQAGGMPQSTTFGWYLYLQGTAYSWGAAYVNAQSMKEYYQNHPPSGVHYVGIELYDFRDDTGAPKMPDICSKLRYADICVYDQDGWGDNGGAFDWDHNAIETNHDAPTLEPNPIAGHTHGTTKMQHNPEMSNRLVNLRDRYTLDDLEFTTRIFCWRIENT